MPLKEEKEELVKDTLNDGNIEMLGTLTGVEGTMQEDLEAEGRKVAGVDSVVDSKGTVGIDWTRSDLGNCIAGYEHGVTTFQTCICKSIRKVLRAMTLMC